MGINSSEVLLQIGKARAVQNFFIVKRNKEELFGRWQRTAVVVALWEPEVQQWKYWRTGMESYSF